MQDGIALPTDLLTSLTLGEMVRIFIFLKRYFYFISIGFLSACMSAYHACALFKENGRKCWIFQNWSYSYRC